MPAAVETMAYTNEVPWHGLGVKVAGNLSVDQMLKAAGLDWTVDRMPLAVGTWKQEKTGLVPVFSKIEAVDGFAALVRSKDRKVFDVVGSQYTPTQNKQAFEFFVEFIKAGKATMETAGSLRGGRVVWGLANLNASFKLSSTDVVKAYLLCVNPHEQGKSRRFKFTSVRVVCNNTLAMALGEHCGEHRQSHRGEFDDIKIERAKEALGIARDQFGEFEKAARKLKAKKMSRNKGLELLIPVFSAGDEVKDVIANFDKEASSKLKAIMGAVNNAPGAEPDNAWGWLNGVTYWADHIASRGADKRLSNAWLGRTANQKEQVLEILLAA